MPTKIDEAIKSNTLKQKNMTTKAEVLADAEAEGQKQKQVRAKRPNQQPQLEEGDNAKFMTNGIQIMQLPKIDTNNNEQVEQRITEYFNISITNDVKPSVAGLALALGIDRRTLWTWLNDGVKSKPKDVIDTLKKAMSFLNLQMEDYMQNGKLNPVSAIFLLKNNHGYRDQQEVVITPNQVTEQTESNLLEESNLLPED